MPTTLFSLQRLHLVGYLGRAASALAPVNLSLLHLLMQRLGQPIFSAIDTTAAQRDG